MARAPDNLRSQAARARREADYAAGRADGLEWAVEACDRSTPAIPRPETGQRPARQPTQDHVLAILRSAGRGLTINEIISEAHRLSYDLRWDTVRDALERALDRGQVTRRRGRYEIVPLQLPGPAADDD